MLKVALLLCLLAVAMADPISNKIVGGHDTDIREVPYQVSLFNQYVRCGGSILNEWTVITAAHCVGDSNFVVRAGATLYGEEGSRHQISEIRVHPENNYPNFDIAIIKLKDPLVFSDTIKPIAIATVEPAAGTPALASGWGQTSDPGNAPQILQSVTVPIAERQWCRDTYGVGDSVICAGPHENGRGTCYGDSGGPLVANGQLVGVVSFGHYDGCAVAQGPNGFGNVAFMSGWIRQNM